MDTRTKIVQSFETTDLKTIVGYYDPLHAGHIRRLREFCRPGERLAIVVADPPQPILPTRARAELIASLECVAQVIAAGSSADEIVRGFTTVIDDRPHDSNRSQEFAQHVLARHNAQ